MYTKINNFAFELSTRGRFAVDTEVIVEILAGVVSVLVAMFIAYLYGRTQGRKGK